MPRELGRHMLSCRRMPREICQDRACSTRVTSFSAKGTSGAAPTSLVPGTYFWRLHGTQSGTIGTATR